MVTLRITLLLLTAAVPFLVGCRRADQAQPPEHQTAAKGKAVQVALLGDRSRIDLLRLLAEATDTTASDDSDDLAIAYEINSRRVTVTTNKSDVVAAHASVCSRANFAIIAVDARNGPMPVHREHILFARLMDIPDIMIVFTHSDAIEDRELLELEELEMRELLSAFDGEGDEAIVAFDSEEANVDQATSLVGAGALSRFLSEAKERAETPPDVETADFSCDVYALAKQEASFPAIRGISSADYAVILGNRIFTAEIQPASRIQPGESGAARLTFASPVRVHSGQRCAILVADHMAAVATIKNTNP